MNVISARVQIMIPVLPKAGNGEKAIKHSSENPIMQVVNGHFSWFAAEAVCCSLKRDRPQVRPTLEGLLQR